MEQNLAEINEELEQVDVNSQAFKDLSKAAQDANKVLEKTNTEIEGITSQEKADSAVKLGEGLVGGFAAAQSAAALFGAESAAAFEKASQQAILLFTALDGAKKVTEVFSKDTIKGLKGIRDGFKANLKSVKTFASTTKGALASTGIGLLVLAVGTLVANWEAVTKAVRDFASSIPALQPVIEFVDTIVNGFKQLPAILAGIKEAVSATFDFSDERTIEEAFKDGFDEAVKLQDAVEDLNKFQTEGTKEIDRQIRLLEAKGDQEEEIFKLKEQQLRTEIELLKATQDLTAEQEEQLLELDNQLEVLRIQESNRKQALIDEQAKTAEAEKQKKIAEEVAKAEKEAEENAKRSEAAQNKVFQEQVKQTDLISKFRFEDASTLEKIATLTEQVELNERLIAQWRDAAANTNPPLSEEFLAEAEAVKTTNIEIGRQIVLLQRQAALEKEAANLEAKEEEKKIIDEKIAQLKIIIELKQKEIEKAQAATQEFRNNTIAITEQIVAVGDVALQVFDGIFGFLDNRVINLEQQLELVRAEAEGSQDIVDDATSKLEDLNDEAKDANGERLAEINELIAAQQEQIEAEKAGIEEKNELEKKLENDLIKAKNNVAKAEKAQAITQAIINGALAIGQALATTPFPLSIPQSIAVGAIAASQLAAVTAAVFKPLPQFAEGGFTADGSKHEVAGVVHAGEYVVPQSILQTSEGSRMAETLEAMRLGLKGYADGGMVTTPDSVGTGDLQSASMVNALENANIYVSVQEIRDVNTNVEVIETKASI